MSINNFMLLVFLMLNFIEKDKDTAPKAFLFGSDLFICVSSTILTVGLKRKISKVPLIMVG